MYRARRVSGLGISGHPGGVHSIVLGILSFELEQIEVSKNTSVEEGDAESSRLRLRRLGMPINPRP